VKELFGFSGYIEVLPTRQIFCEWCGCVLAIETGGARKVEPEMGHADDCPERPRVFSAAPERGLTNG